MSKTINIVKIALALILVIFLAQMSYGFGEFVRFIAMIGFAFVAYRSDKKGSRTEMFFFIAFAIICQPFFEIPLGHEIWNILDTVFLIGITFVIFRTWILNQ